MTVRVGIDTGGTFTDLVAVDEETGRWYVAKVPSNPEDPVAAVAAALAAGEFRAEDVASVVVGTTIGINAVLTRNRRPGRLPDYAGLRGHPVHPEDQSQVSLRLHVAQADHRSSSDQTASGSWSGSTRRGRSRLRWTPSG